MRLIHRNNTQKSNIDYCPISEKIIIFAICYSVAFPMVDSLVNRYCDVEFWDSLFTKGIYYSLLLMATYYAVKRKKNIMIFVPLLLIGLWFLSYFLFPSNRLTLIEEVLLPLMTVSLPLFVVTCAVRDYKRLYNSLRITSIIVISCSYVYLYLQYQRIFLLNYMEFSYQMLFSVMFLIIYSMQSKNKLDIVMAITGVIIITICGARGAIIGLLFGIIISAIIIFKLTLMRAILVAMLAIMIINMSSNISKWFIAVNDDLYKINASSRTIQLILENDISKLSGRDMLFAQTLKAISDNIFVGAGMDGDRTLLGTYTHNLFTELILQYGIVLGLIFIAVLCYYLFSALLVKNKNELYFIFLSVFATTGFVKLLFSSSYLLEPTFFVMLALAILLVKYRRKFPDLRV